MPWVGLQFVIAVFPDHTHLLFGCKKESCHWEIRIFLLRILIEGPDQYTYVGFGRFYLIQVCKVNLLFLKAKTFTEMYIYYAQYI